MRAILPMGLMLLAMAQPSVHADATLSYRLTPTEGEEAATLRIAAARFFARIESSASPGGRWLFQAGKFFPLYRVDDAAKTWTRLTPEVTPRLGPVSRTASSARVGNGQADGAPGVASAAAAPGLATADERAPARPAVMAAADAAPSAAAAVAEDAAAPKSTQASAPAVPKFQPTPKMEEVAGVRCRVVEELRDGEPVIEHCMANKAALGITEREIRTLARTFAMARQQGLGWLGTATADEEFISVRSRTRDGGVLLLAAVSTEPLPAGHLRIPRAYREISRTTQAPEPQPEQEAAAAAGGPSAQDEARSSDASAR